jgi:hypothetical protein
MRRRPFDRQEGADETVSFKFEIYIRIHSFENFEKARQKETSNHMGKKLLIFVDLFG